MDFGVKKILKAGAKENFQGAAHFEEGNYESHHAKLCASILSLPLSEMPDNKRPFHAGLINADPHNSELIWDQIRTSPSLKIITISSSQRLSSMAAWRNKTENIGANDYPKLVFCANGNDGEVAFIKIERSRISNFQFMPGMFRVGEADASGKRYEASSVSGPAFICSHPFHLSEFKLDFNGQIYTSLRGSSLAAPYAAALIMKQAELIKDLSNFDIMSAVLVACAKHDFEDHDALTNARGLPFSNQYGFGCLKEGALIETLRQAKDIKSFMNHIPRDTITVSTDISLSDTNHKHFAVPAINSEGVVVNFNLLMKFSDAAGFNSVDVISPQGTKISLLSQGRSVQSGRYCVSFNTSGFFGEKYSRGAWAIAGDWKKPPIEASITTHAMPYDSAGARLLKYFLA